MCLSATVTSTRTTTMTTIDDGSIDGGGNCLNERIAPHAKLFIKPSRARKWKLKKRLTSCHINPSIHPLTYIQTYLSSCYCCGKFPLEFDCNFLFFKCIVRFLFPLSHYNPRSLHLLMQFFLLIWPYVVCTAAAMRRNHQNRHILRCYRFVGVSNWFMSSIFEKERNRRQAQTIKHLRLRHIALRVVWIIWIRRKWKFYLLPWHRRTNNNNNIIKTINKSVCKEP